MVSPCTSVPRAGLAVSVWTSSLDCLTFDRRRYGRVIFGRFLSRITLKGTFSVSRPIVVWQTNSSARICVVEDNAECGDSGLHVPEPSIACRFGRTFHHDNMESGHGDSVSRQQCTSHDWHMDGGIHGIAWLSMLLRQCSGLFTIVANRHEMDRDVLSIPV